MSTEDKEALNEFMRAFLFGIVVLVGIFIIPVVAMNTATNWLEMQPTPADKKFEVVDRYKGCNVIRYAPDNSARYSYFLDCKK